jgi:hypothetical protein
VLLLLLLLLLNFVCTASTLKERVFNVGLAAILAKGVYNFGELLAHPALDVLRNTEHQWLVDLLFAFNSGNIGELDALQTQWKQQVGCCLLGMSTTVMQYIFSMLCRL